VLEPGQQVVHLLVVRQVSPATASKLSTVK
jgi:hypothetical protein